MDNITWSDLPVKFPEYNEETDILVRQSLIGDMQFCEYRVKLKTHEGYLESLSEAATFGTCIHYLISEDLTTGEPRLDLISNMEEWVEEILVAEDWSLSKVPNAQDFMTELTNAYRIWRHEVYPQLPEAISLEEEMYLPLGGSYYLRGTSDAVFDNVIMDWKTSGRDWKEGKADMSIQASLYMALVKQNLGKSIRKFEFWVFNRKKREWVSFPTSRRIKEINSALLSAYDYAYKMDKEAYTATPVTDTFGKKVRGWYCSPKWCGAWNICPAKYLNDNKNETEIAVRSWN